MQYASFRIQNFKGIVDTKIDVQARGGSRTAVTLVGLNESGKTTILEAIHSFSPDESTNVLLSGKTLEKVAPESLIPRQDQANFNGNVSVTAEVVASDEDIEIIRARVFSKHGIKLEVTDFPKRFTVERRLVFEISRHRHTYVIYGLKLFGSEAGKRKVKEILGAERAKVISEIKELLPPIKYFPTFLFEFPDKIYLNSGASDGRNDIYKEMFQDVLTATGKGYKIGPHIVDRLGYSEEKHGLFATYLTIFLSSFDKAAIESVVSEAGARVTAVVMKRWNEVFSDKIRNKEIVIEFEAVKGGNSEYPLAAVRFWVKEGLDRFKVSERSLGFRWFLCFLLFTQFLSKDKSTNALFLFDEPASNLHARAQQQLLDSFMTIVSNSGGLIYSTHSHHMISPAWLEMAYIVENAAISYDEDEFSVSISDKTQVEAIPYRQFVSSHPEKRSYFQPILDRLDYAPSALEFVDRAVFVEGKSDFYIMKYFFEVIIKAKKIDIMPSTGANDLGLLISLYLGWGKRFLVLLDGDKAGRLAKEKYVEQFFLSPDSVLTLSELVSGSSITAVESLLGTEVYEKVQKYYATPKRPSKKDVTRYFQEAYAAGRVEKFSKETVARFRDLLTGLSAKLPV